MPGTHNWSNTWDSSASIATLILNLGSPSVSLRRQGILQKEVTADADKFLWPDCTHLGSSQVMPSYKKSSAFAFVYPCLLQDQVPSMIPALHHSPNLCFSSPTSVCSPLISSHPPTPLHLAYVILVLFWYAGSIHNRSLFVLYHTLLLQGRAFYNLSASLLLWGSSSTPNDLFSDFCPQPWLLFWAPQLPVTTSQLKHLKPLILLLPKPGFPNSVTGPSSLQPSSVEPQSSLPCHPYLDQSVISLTKSFFFLQSFHFQPNSGPTAIPSHLWTSPQSTRHISKDLFP